MKLILRCLLAPLALSTASLLAQVTITVTGMIAETTNTSGLPASGPFATAFPIGTSFTATFTYEPATADVDSRLTDGAYLNSTSFGATFTAGAYTFSSFAQPSIIQVFNNSVDNGPPMDGLIFSFGGDASVQAGGFRPTGFVFKEMTGSVNTFSNDLLTNVVSGTWVLGDFQSQTPYISIGFTDGRVFGYASSFSVSAVPEPSAYAMLSGVGALVFVLWRRQRLAAA